jgi:hypothetical protein
MPLRFTLTVAGDVQMDREIEAIEVHAKQLDAVLRDIAVDLRKVTAEQFRTEGAYASGGWPALSEAYAKRKAQMVAQGKVIAGREARYTDILRLTDRLRQSLVYKTDPEHIEHISNHVLTWGTRVPYARYHQNPQSGQKRRRMLELPERKRQQYARAILTYIRTGRTGLAGL